MTVAVSSVAVIGAALILALAQIGRDLLWQRHHAEMDEREQKRHEDRMALGGDMPTGNGLRSIPVEQRHSVSD